jgi:hypothetical protein
MKTLILYTILIGSTLFGTVVDKNSGEKLAGVNINSTTFTDLDGHFKIDNPTDTLKINFISYNDTTIVFETKH